MRTPEQKSVYVKCTDPSCKSNNGLIIKYKYKISQMENDQEST